MNLFIAVTTLIALPLLLNNEPFQSMEKQALSDTQRTLASDYDAELPRLPFTDWFGKVVGPRAGVIWQLGECGDRIDAAPNGGGDVPACVEANAILSDGSRVIVAFTVGTFKKGVTGRPAFRAGVIEQDGALRPIKRLRDLQRLLSGTGKQAKSPAAELPEVSLPSVRLAANNASSTGTPPWVGEDFGLLTPIEDPGPPPAEPIRTRPATSSSASNTDKQNDSGAVRQGAAAVKIQPTYPRGAKKFNASGTVEVQIMISVTGSVTAARATSGHPLLRKAAEEAARKWEFIPTTVNGDPIETQMVLTFVFKVPE